MTRIHVDGLRVRSWDDLHAVVADTEGVPPWYGRNLDALSDLLTGVMGGEVELRFTAMPELAEALGDDGLEDLVTLLIEALQANPQLLVVLGGEADAAA